MAESVFFWKKMETNNLRVSSRMSTEEATAVASIHSISVRSTVSKTVCAGPQATGFDRGVAAAQRPLPAVAEAAAGPCGRRRVGSAGAWAVEYMPKRPLALLGKALVAIKIDGADGVQHTPFALGETVSRVQCERLQPYGTGPATQHHAPSTMRGAALWVAYAPRTIARICPASSVAAFCWICGRYCVWSCLAGPSRFWKVSRSMAVLITRPPA